MLLLVFRNCCRLLWKGSNKPIIDYLAVVIIIACYGQVIESHNMQRRFMWKDMDDTMDDIVDGMAIGARAMRNMIGEFLPLVQTTTTPFPTHSVMDYLPSETTRVRYIIRNPPKQMKTVKIIKVRSPKKIVKLMPPPSSSKAVNHSQKTLMMVTKPLTKPKLFYPSPEEMRKLEKEQELIAEGRLPAKMPNDILATVTIAAHKDVEIASVVADTGKVENNEIIAGKIFHYGDGWKPVGFSTIRPYVISQLHTNVANYEPLPEPEKQIYAPSTDENGIQPTRNTYEVTEYAAEESVAMPLIEKKNSKNSRSHSFRIGGFIPSRGLQLSGYSPSKAPPTTTTTTTMTTITTTTEEEPNYPVSFLRKYRERNAQQMQQQHVRQQQQKIAASAPVSSYHRYPNTNTTTTAITTATGTSRFRASEAAVGASWMPTSAVNATTRSTHTAASTNNYHYHQLRSKMKPQTGPLVHVIKSEKWPPETTTTTAASPSPFRGYSPTTGTGASVRQFEYTTESPTRTTRKSNRIASTLTKSTTHDSRPRDIRQRGSVKFGDKMNLDQL